MGPWWPFMQASSLPLAASKVYTHMSAPPATKRLLSTGLSVAVSMSISRLCCARTSYRSASMIVTCLPEAVVRVLVPSFNSMSMMLPVSFTSFTHEPPPLRSHTRITPSSAPVMMWPPSMDHSSLRTATPCLMMVGSALGLPRSKMRIILSLPPVASRAPSALKSTLLTMWLWSKAWSSAPLMASHSLAEKSALPVAHCVAVRFSFADHTAPLCPSNVPIQSPVDADRSMGSLSTQPDTKKTPSGVSGL
mmetsp:Transcript_27313/g.76729  ORF Transcript_27313/g.76729 Transcript_27313/m.76729 type:complete len:249 (+) Transcript_27313:302-1048(+)